MPSLSNIVTLIQRCFHYDKLKIQLPLVPGLNSLMFQITCCRQIKIVIKPSFDRSYKALDQSEKLILMFRPITQKAHVLEPKTICRQKIYHKG